MTFIKKYLKYLSSNPKNYWFKRKLYGWGWVPVKWQGWLTLLAFMVFLLWNSLIMSETVSPTQTDIVWFFGKSIIAVVLLISICYKTGEKPKWQWGNSKK
jgi:hypothetical protein